MSTTTNLSSLVINYLTQSQYDAAAQAGTLNENQIYLTPAVELATVATSGNYLDLSNKPTIPTKVSDLTNDSGFITASDIASVMTYKGTKANYAALPSTGNTTGDVWHLTDTGAEWAWDGSVWQELGTVIDLSGYVPTSRTVNGKALSSNISLTASDVGAAESSHIHGYLTNNGTFSTQSAIGNGDYLVITDKSDSYKLKHSGLAFDGSTTTKALTQKGTWETFLQSYTETDPIFSASAAAGITATDISNWNAKVSDTGKWNDVSLNKTPVSETGKEKVYVPLVTSTSSTTAYLMEATFSDGTKAGSIARYNANSYLISTTPSANDNSTKVATTAWVTTAIPKVYSSTNTGGYLTMATLPIYDGTVV